MKLWILQRRYLQKLIETESRKVKFSRQRVFHKVKVGKTIPLLVTYHALLKFIGKIIYDKLYLLYMNENTFLHQKSQKSLSEVLGRF